MEYRYTLSSLEKDLYTYVSTEGKDEAGLRAAEFCNASTDAEVLRVGDAVSTAISTAKSETGVDVSQAKIEALPGNIAGQYNRATQAITFDQALFSVPSVTDYIEHVALHEAYHRRIHDASENGQRLEVWVEEAAVEKLTARDTGRTIAYHEEQVALDRAIDRAGTTENNVLQMIVDGQVAKVNYILTPPA